MSFEFLREKVCLGFSHFQLHRLKIVHQTFRCNPTCTYDTHTAHSGIWRIYPPCEMIDPLTKSTKQSAGLIISRLSHGCVHYRHVSQVWALITARGGPRACCRPRANTHLYFAQRQQKTNNKIQKQKKQNKKDNSNWANNWYNDKIQLLNKQKI